MKTKKMVMMMIMIKNNMMMIREMITMITETKKEGENMNNKIMLMKKRNTKFLDSPL